MSTGVKIKDNVIGVDVNGKPLYHVAQRAEVLKKSTGVITSVQWSHATPAGFVAHNASRNNYAELANEMINDSGTDVIMGAGSPLFDDSGAPVTPTEYKYVGGVDTWNALVNGTAGGDADGDGDADPWKLIQSKFQFKRLAYGPHDAGARLRYGPRRHHPAAEPRRRRQGRAVHGPDERQRPRPRAP